MRIRLHPASRPSVLTALIVVACMSPDSDGMPDEGLLTVPREEAPTGAKVEVNAYGEAQILDEECGAIATAAYPEYFQSAMFRDAALGGDPTAPVLYSVDGAHLWRAAVSGTTLGEPSIWRRFVGRATAVQAVTDAVLVGTIDGQLIVYNHDGTETARLDLADRVLDLAVSSHHLIAALGADGLMSFDLQALIHGQDAFRDARPVNHFASGVRFASEMTGPAGMAMFAYSACRTAGMFFLDADGYFGELIETDDLIHHNAKDAAVGNNLRLAIANNGLGLWFMDAGSSPGRSDFKQILDLDPAFYANSVVPNRDATQVYLAAGNQSLQMHVFDMPDPPPPPPPIRRDPIDVEYVWPVSTEARVVGLGNFRQVGERTVLWADSGLLGVDELREPGTGWLSQSAPGDVSGETGLLLSMPTAMGFTTYFMPLTADTQAMPWREHYPGLYVRTMDAQLLSTPAGTDAVARLNLNLNLGADTDTTDTVGVFEFGRGASDPYERVLVMLDETPAVVTGPLAHWVVPADSTDVVPGSLKPVFLDTVVPRAVMERGAPCGLAPAPRGPSFLERTGYGSLPQDDHYVVWCSRKDDPWVPGKSPQHDTGTLIYQCEPPASATATPSCTRRAKLVESNLVHIVPADSGYWALMDDRRSYSYSWLRLSPEFQVTKRYIYSGRPVAWLQRGAAMIWVDQQMRLRELNVTNSTVTAWIGGGL